MPLVALMLSPACLGVQRSFHRNMSSSTSVKKLRVGYVPEVRLRAPLPRSSAFAPSVVTDDLRRADSTSPRPSYGWAKKTRA